MAALTRTVGRLALGEAAVVVVRRVGLGVQAAGEDDARDLLLRAAARRSRPPMTPPAVWVQRTGVKPCWARAPLTTSAKAGKIGFWSSGMTRPTSRARSPRSLVGRS